LGIFSLAPKSSFCSDCITIQVEPYLDIIAASPENISLFGGNHALICAG
jgi:hypothetical protein